MTPPIRPLAHPLMDTLPGITLLDIDPSLHPLAEQLLLPVETVAFGDLPSFRKMCSRSTFELIRQRLETRPYRDCTLIGSDDYHHLTYALLLTLPHPFTLVLFDNHSDFMPTPLGEEIISCGSWVADVMRMPLARSVVIVGASPDTMLAIPGTDWDRVVYLPQQDVPPSVLEPLPPAQQHWLTRHPSIESVGVRAAFQAVFTHLDPAPLYISVDKDVLSVEHASVTWSQGTMTLDQMVQSLQWLANHGSVAALDICGDEPISPMAFARGEAGPRLQQSALVNGAILHAVMAQAPH